MKKILLFILIYSFVLAIMGFVITAAITKNGFYGQIAGILALIGLTIALGFAIWELINDYN